MTTVSMSLRQKLPPVDGRSWLDKHPIIKGASINVIDSDLYGIELEVENLSIRTAKNALAFQEFPNHPPILNTLVKVVEDASLGAGCEFVLCPLTPSEARVVIPEILKRLPPYDITDRCSTHVHMNVLDLQWTDVRGVLYVYLLLEPFIYRWIGGDRDHNVFAVPLSCGLDTNGTSDWFKRPMMSPGRYLGMNVAPVINMGENDFAGGLIGDNHMHPTGTLEFRQMHGLTTKQMPKLYSWLDALSSIKQAGKLIGENKKLQHEIFELNSSSRYGQVLREIAPVAYDMLIGDTPQHEIMRQMERTVMCLKLMEKKNDFMVLPENFHQSPYAKTLKKRDKKAPEPEANAQLLQAHVDVVEPRPRPRRPARQNNGDIPAEDALQRDALEMMRRIQLEEERRRAERARGDF